MKTRASAATAEELPSVTEVAQTEARAGLHVAIRLLQDGITADELEREIRAFDRKVRDAVTKKYGKEFALAVRQERRSMLFKELYSNPDKWEYINTMLPLEEIDHEDAKGWN